MFLITYEQCYDFDTTYDKFVQWLSDKKERGIRAEK